VAEPAPKKVVEVEGSALGFANQIRTGSHQLTADEPTEAGGTNTGPSPYELLLSALGACTSMTVSMYARRKSWPLESVKVHLTHAKVDGKDQIERDITLVGPLDQEQKDRLLEIANKCPVHKTLTSQIDIRSRLA
jgi:putative redox protein